MKNYARYWLIGIVIFFLGFGTFFLATFSAVKSLDNFGEPNYYLFRHLLRIGIGVILALAIFKIPLSYIKKTAPLILIINIILMLAVLFFGNSFGGAKRWISLGNATFQPAEFLKITAIIYLAALITSKLSENQKKNFMAAAKKSYYNFTRIFLPFLSLMVFAIAILYFQKDLGTLGIIIIALAAVYFASGAPLWHIALAAILAIASAVIFIWKEPYRRDRLKVFLNPLTDPMGVGRHIQQALIAIGSGGIIGKGLGMSMQKFDTLPQAMDDSIFAVIGEETGFIGALILVVAFLIFLFFGVMIAKRAEDRFSRAVAVGITIWITIQAFMNMASVIGAMPLTGVPLPFFSYGGSHIISELVAIGILLNISKNRLKIINEQR